jgi:hypothetical protein
MRPGGGRDAFPDPAAGSTTGRTDYRGGRFGIDRLHPFDIPQRRRPELATILTAELRGAFVPNLGGGACDVQIFASMRRLASRRRIFFLVLEWTHGRYRTKMVMKRRNAHADIFRRLSILSARRSSPLASRWPGQFYSHGFRWMRSVADVALVTHKDPINDLFVDERREDGNILS